MYFFSKKQKKFVGRRTYYSKNPINCKIVKTKTIICFAIIDPINSPPPFKFKLLLIDLGEGGGETQNALPIIVQNLKSFQFLKKMTISSSVLTYPKYNFISNNKLFKKNFFYYSPLFLKYEIKNSKNKWFNWFSILSNVQPEINISNSLSYFQKKFLSYFSYLNRLSYPIDGIYNNRMKIDNDPSNPILYKIGLNLVGNIKQTELKKYSKFHELKLVSISIASPEKIKEWAEKILPNGKIFGEVTNPNTLHYKTFKPHKGGLFCERIFGPLKDFECACGVYSKPPIDSLSIGNKISYLNSLSYGIIDRHFCPTCDVEYTWSVIRRYQLGYIQLISPVSHIWYLKATPSYLSILLDLKKSFLESIIYCTESITLENIFQKSEMKILDKSPKNIYSVWQKFIEKKNLFYRTYFYKNKPKNHNRFDFLKLTYLNEFHSPYYNNSSNLLIAIRYKLNRMDLDRDSIYPLLFNYFNYLIELGIGFRIVYNAINSIAINRLWNLINSFLKYKFYYSYYLQNNHLFIVNLKYSINRFNKIKLEYFNNRIYNILNLEYKLNKIIPIIVYKIRSSPVLPRFNNYIAISKTTKIVSRRTSARDKKIFDSFQKIHFEIQRLKKYIIANNLLLYRSNLIKKFVPIGSHTSSKFTDFSYLMFFIYFLLFSRKNLLIAQLNRIKIKLLIAKIENYWLSYIFRIFMNQPAYNKIYSSPIELLAIDRIFLEFYYFFLNSKMKDIFQTQNDFFYLIGFKFISKIKKIYGILNIIESHPSKNILTNKIASYLIAHIKKDLGILFFVLKKTKKFTLSSYIIATMNYRTHNNRRLLQLLNSAAILLKLNSYYIASYTQLNRIFHPTIKFFKFFKFLGFIGSTSLSLHSMFYNRGSNPILLGIPPNRLNRTRKEEYMFPMGIVSKPINSYYNIAKIKKYYYIARAYPILLQFFQNPIKIGFKLLLSNFTRKLIENLLIASYLIGGKLYKIDGISLTNKIGRNIIGESKLSIFNKKLFSSYFTSNNPMNNKIGWKNRNKLKNNDISYNNNKIMKNPLYIIGCFYPWDIQINWKYFIYYNPINPINTLWVLSHQKKINYYISPINNSYLNPYPILLGAAPYIAKINRKLNSNLEVIIGASFIQYFIKEFHHKLELKKIMKQHQILIPILNKSIRKWKKFRNQKKFSYLIGKFFQKKNSIIRRLKLLSKIFHKKTNPNSMILSVLPVLPPDLRPILKLQNQIAASDLNRFYQRILYRNERLKKFLKDPSTSQSFEMKYAQRLLQESVDNLIENGKGGKAETNSRGQPLKSLSEILKGKQGRFRQYLLGKRVDYSGRSVIVVGPKLKLSECGLPFKMAIELFLPFLIKKILDYKFAKTVIGAKNFLYSNKKFTWNLLVQIMKNHPILLNRAPTLHRLGIQAFLPKLIHGQAILLHPLVCPAFNADFDGDQMAVHVPITIEARAEAWSFLLSRNHLLSPNIGEPILLPSQDMVLGCYYLTSENPSSRLNNYRIGYKIGSNMKPSYDIARIFHDWTSILTAYQTNQLSLQSLIWLRWMGKIEFSNEFFLPVEIKIHKFGQSQKIKSKFYYYLDYNNNILSQYIRTTPGKVLINNIIKNSIDY